MNDRGIIEQNIESNDNNDEQSIESNDNNDTKVPKDLGGLNDDDGLITNPDLP